MTLPRIIGIAAVVIVIGVVAAAFATIGSPARARAEALDRQRVSDVGDMAAELHENYVDARTLVPNVFPRPRRDPVTAKPYEYHRESNQHFTLCAVFELPTSRTDADVAAFWHHSAGRHCFRFDVTQRVESTL